MEDLKECIICTEELNDKTKTCKQCKIEYHQECHQQWIDHGGSECPHCRRKLSDIIEKKPKKNNFCLRLIAYMCFFSWSALTCGFLLIIVSYKISYDIKLGNYTFKKIKIN